MAPWPVPRLDREPAAVGLGEAAGDREPEPGARRRAGAARRAGTARRSARARRAGCPGRGRSTRIDTSGRGRGDLDAHRLVARRVLERVLDQVHERPLDLLCVHLRPPAARRAARPRRGRRRNRARRAPRRRGRRPRSARARGSAAPAWSRERSSRFADELVEPVEAARIVASSSARSAASIARSGRASAPAEVEIAINGVRRSWLTERSSAVLIASARRSASASNASRSSRSRSIATPSSEASAGSSRRRAPSPSSAPGQADRPDAPPAGRQRVARGPARRRG